MADPVIVLPTRQFLRQAADDDAIYAFLERLSLDMNSWDDDFQGDTLHGGYQSTASGVGALAAAMNTGANGGQVRLVTGTGDDGRSDLSLGRHYRGDQNAVIAVRCLLDVITSVKLEVGFTDVVSGTDAGAVNVLATPSFTATDFVGFVLDTDDTANFKFLGVANGTASAVVSTARAPTAATFEWYVVSLRDGAARGYILTSGGGRVYDTGWVTGAVTSTVLLTPWVFVQARTASASKNCDIDRLVSWQRTTT